MRSRTSSCQREALFIRNRFSRPGETLRRPSVVLLMMGNSATSVAQTTSAAVGCLTQMMISGAMATMGVTCSSTA
jgi:Na+/phosphate symporter